MVQIFKSSIIFPILISILPIETILCQQAASYQLQVYYKDDPQESSSLHQGPYYAKLQAYPSSTPAPELHTPEVTKYVKYTKAPTHPTVNQKKVPKANPFVNKNNNQAKLANSKQKKVPTKVVKVPKKIVKNTKPKVKSSEEVESKETFYKSFKRDKDSKEMDDSVEHNDDFSAESSENYSAEHKSLTFPLASNKKEGPVLSFVKTDKGSYNWAIRYPL